MSRSSRIVITLPVADRRELAKRARSYTSPHAEVVRARIVLLAADGEANVAIARRRDVGADVVSKWRKRFCEDGLCGALRPQLLWPAAGVPGPVVSQVKAMVCEPPGRREVPLSRWSSAELAAQAAVEALMESVSASTVHRWLAEDAIKPRRAAGALCPAAEPRRRHDGVMPTPPASTKTSLGQRLSARARERWPTLSKVGIRFHGAFAYVSGHLPDGEVLPLCRLRYGGSATRWGFAIYRASHDDYQDSFLPSGYTAGTPEEALDCACGLYLGDPTAWLPGP